MSIPLVSLPLLLVCLWCTIRVCLPLHCAIMADPHVLVNTTCFVWYSTDFLSFHDAKTRCHDHDQMGYYGQMAVLNTQTQLDAVKQLLDQQGHHNRFSHAHVGLERNNSECVNAELDGLQWLDGSPAPTNLSWWDPTGNSSCNHTAGGMSYLGLLNLEADYKRTYICSFEEPPTSTNSIACPLGSIRNEGRCIYLHNETLPFIEARDICANGSLGFYGDLIMPRDKTQSALLGQYVFQKTGNAYAWLGMRRRNSRCTQGRLREGGFFFDDGTPFDPTSLSFVRTTQYTCSHFPTFYIHPSTAEPLGNAVTQRFAIMCEFDRTVYPDACVGVNVTTLGNTCYYFSTRPLLTYRQAQIACRDGRFGFQGYLAMPKNEEQRLAIREAAIKQDEDKMWVGIRLRGSRCFGNNDDMLLLTGEFIEIKDPSLGPLGLMTSCTRKYAKANVTTGELSGAENGTELNHAVCQYEPGCAAPEESSDYFIPASWKTLYKEVKGPFEGVSCQLGEDHHVSHKARCFVHCSEHRLCHALTYFHSGVCRLHWASPHHNCFLKQTNSTATLYDRL